MTFPANPDLVAAKSTLVDLHRAIKARLQNEVAPLFPSLETKDPNVSRAPTLLDGFVPPKPGGDAAQYPFMIVCPRSGTDTEQGADQNATAVFEIVIGTYSDADDGWLDVLMLIDAIRDNFGSAPSIEGTAFEQTGPMTWVLDEAQPRPQWLGSVKSTWTLPRPVRVEARNPNPQQEG